MSKDLKDRIAEEWGMLDPVDPLRGLLSDVIDVLAQPSSRNEIREHRPAPPECKTEAEQTAYAFGWWKALESVRTEPDWKDLFEKQKRRAEMWIAKYEKDIGSLEKAAPIAQKPVATMKMLHTYGDTTPQQQEPRNFCSRCGKRTADLTVIHTCTPPEGGHQ